LRGLTKVPVNSGVDFHTFLVQAADNPYLEQGLASAEGRIDLARRLASSAAVRHGADSTHSAILAAVEVGHGVVTEAAMRHHFTEQSDHLISQLLYAVNLF
jgi:DNA-binding GntR family transcriptional regulator